MGLFSWAVTENRKSDEAKQIEALKAELTSMAGLCKELRDDRDRAMEVRNRVVKESLCQGEEIRKKDKAIKGWEETAKGMADDIAAKNKQIAELQGELGEQGGHIRRLEERIKELREFEAEVNKMASAARAFVKAYDATIPF